ncbi:helix-turn-helix domain-containing protein [Photobacterium ganghwense]|uniref:helix-turn-helix domain-containing protein n=1 Tax=Photobacterium ganghwense TaxID=320778 RepID=UPI001A8DCBA8|nr:helix-turn-helix domain-containing protein [Photobacterium ganghwense]QSV17517.1 helix-turn-helix domain-containing protein [Photobacterium ganghwense]
MTEENKKIEAVPQQEEERKAWILYQLKIRQLTLAELARRNKVSRQVLSKALTAHSPRWEKIIAEAIDYKPEDVWPERFKRYGVAAA